MWLLQSARSLLSASGRSGVGLDSEGNRNGHVRLLSGSSNADGLFRAVHGNGTHHIRGRAGKRVDLFPMIGLRFLLRHGPIRDIAVSPRTEASADDHRGPIDLAFAPNLLEQANGDPVCLRKSVGRVAEPRSQSALARHVALSSIRPALNRLASSAYVRKYLRSAASPSGISKRWKAAKVGKLQSFVED